MLRMMMRKQDGIPPAFVHDLHREDQTLQERSMCGCGSQSPEHGTTGQRTEEYVRLACLANVCIRLFRVD